MRRFWVAAALVAAGMGPAAALPPLAQNEVIIRQLVEARGADRIRKMCGHKIAPRMIVAFSKARALKAEAIRAGYAEAEIQSFLDDKDAKKAVYARAETWLSSRGVLAVP